MWIRALAILLVAAIAAVSLLNGRPIYIRFVFENDVVAHAAAFALLTAVVLAAWQRRWPPIALLCLFAVAIELAQLLTPNRQFTLTDLAGNLAGVAAATLVRTALHSCARGKTAALLQPKGAAPRRADGGAEHASRPYRPPPAR